MSCFIHSDETYNKLASCLFAPIKPWWFNKLRDWEHIRELVINIRDWNYRAYAERYNQPYEQESWEPTLSKNTMSLIELLKILQSINYQCIDSREYEKSSEGIFMERVIHELAMGIISDMPEYEKAPWGLGD